MRLSKNRAKPWEKFTNKRTSKRKKNHLYKLRKTVFKQMKKRIQMLNDERYNQIAEELERSNGGGNNKAMYEYNRLIQRKPECRLGYKGIAEIKYHPFFKNVCGRSLAEGCVMMSPYYMGQ